MTKTASLNPRVHYVSPSVVPSRSANSVHVIRQVRALADIGVEVTLYLSRSVQSADELPQVIRQQYGVSMEGIKLVSFFAGTERFVNLKIAAMAAWVLLRDGWPDLIVSRNLYLSYLVGVVARHELVFEIHDLESGLRAHLQRAVLTRPWVRSVTISDQLSNFLNEMHGINTASRVLHDAAPSGITPVPVDKRRALLHELAPVAQGAWSGVCGYIGHLYPGRGIEIIEAMAANKPDVLFVIAGGRETDVESRRERNRNQSNLIFLGHLPHHRALDLAKCVDVLLMPYQTRVSVGVSGRDTARWMSPMKMFEYMATGVPLISSDLPVLREVLEHGRNALMVRADDAAAWVSGMTQLISDRGFAQRLANAARAQYLAHHTWEHRARGLLETMQ